MGAEQTIFVVSFFSVIIIIIACLVSFAFEHPKPKQHKTRKENKGGEPWEGLELWEMDYNTRKKLDKKLEKGLEERMSGIREYEKTPEHIEWKKGADEFYIQNEKKNRDKKLKKIEAEKKRKEELFKKYPDLPDIIKLFKD